MIHILFEGLHFLSSHTHTQKNRQDIKFNPVLIPNLSHCYIFLLIIVYEFH